MLSPVLALSFNSGRTPGGERLRAVNLWRQAGEIVSLSRFFTDWKSGHIKPLVEVSEFIGEAGKTPGLR